MDNRQKFTKIVRTLLMGPKKISSPVLYLHPYIQQDLDCPAAYIYRNTIVIISAEVSIVVFVLVLPFGLHAPDALPVPQLPFSPLYKRFRAALDS
jgi:hypothetical protein